MLPILCIHYALHNQNKKCVKRFVLLGTVSSFHVHHHELKQLAIKVKLCLLGTHVFAQDPR